MADDEEIVLDKEMWEEVAREQEELKRLKKRREKDADSDTKRRRDRE